MKRRRQGARRGERFVLEGLLGRGGMSSVHLAWDLEAERHVALKSLAEHLSGDAGYRARFVREGRLAARVAHPNVVRVHEVGEDEHGLYIVMEHVPGTTLAAEIRRRGRFAPEEAVGVLTQVCAGLARVHDAGLVHRDVTPGNILLTPSGTAKLSDFGIARPVAGTALTEHGTVLGTAAYLAPEQARGEPATPAADLYAVGVVAYELLSGRPPFRAESLPALLLSREQDAAPRLREVAPDVPAPLEAVVAACLERRPEARPASASVLKSELEASLEGEPTQVLSAAAATEILPAAGLTPAAPRRRYRPSRRASLAAAGVMGAAALAAVLAARDAAVGGSPEPPPAQRSAVLAGPPPPPVAPPPAPPPPPAPVVSCEALEEQDEALEEAIDRFEDGRGKGNGKGKGRGKDRGKGHGKGRGGDDGERERLEAMRDDLEARLEECD